MNTSPADELRAAATKLADEPDTRPTLTEEYPSVDACLAQMLRDAANVYDAAVRARSDGRVNEDEFWLKGNLALARRINGGQPEQPAVDGLRRSDDVCPGFPEQCPNIRTVEPDPSVHYGGIRCGCADEDPS